MFRKPLEELWGISATASGLPFMVFLASFAGTMPIAGALLDRWGPSRTALVGGLLVGGGWILAGLSPNIAALALTYGLIAGGAVGFVYGCPILVAARWFPDKRGLAVVLTLIGFGLSPLITAPVVNALITSLGPSLTFIYVGTAFLGILTVLSFPLRLPPSEWYNSASTNHVGQRQQSADLTPREMLKTGAFYALWTTFAIGCLVGLMAIGITAPFGTEVAGLNAGLAA